MLCPRCSFGMVDKYSAHDLYRAAILALDWINGTDTHDQVYIVARLEDALNRAKAADDQQKTGDCSGT
jgi:hypothetical protein